MQAPHIHRTEDATNSNIYIEKVFTNLSKIPLLPDSEAQLLIEGHSTSLKNIRHLLQNLPLQNDKQISFVFVQLQAALRGFEIVIVKPIAVTIKNVLVEVIENLKLAIKINQKYKPPSKRDMLPPEKLKKLQDAETFRFLDIEERINLVAELLDKNDPRNATFFTAIKTPEIKKILDDALTQILKKYSELQDTPKYQQVYLRIRQAVGTLGVYNSVNLALRDFKAKQSNIFQENSFESEVLAALRKYHNEMKQKSQNQAEPSVTFKA